MKHRLVTLFVLTALIAPALSAQQFAPGGGMGADAPSVQAFTAPANDAQGTAAGTTVALSYFNPNSTNVFNWTFPASYGSFVNLYMLQRFTLPGNSAFLDSIRVYVKSISTGSVRFRVYGDTLINFTDNSFRYPTTGITLDDVEVDKSLLKMNAWNTVKFHSAVVPKEFFVSMEFTVAGGNNNTVVALGDSHSQSGRSATNSRVIMVNQMTDGTLQLSILDSLLVESTTKQPIYSHLFMTAYADTATSSPLPVFVSTPVTSAYTDQPYTYQAQATGVPRPQYTLVSGPTGLACDQATGKLTWWPMPADLGPHPVTIRATNANGSAEQSFTLTVVTSSAPKITSYAKRTALVGEPYFYQVTATGGPAPTFNLTTGPSGMTLDKITGQLAMTPTGAQTGTFIVSVSAVNALGSDAQTFVLAIDASASGPKITSTAKTTATLGQPYTYDVAASGNPQATFSLVKAPSGMTINSNTGSITWTPGAVGSNDVTVRATNRVASDDQSYTLTVTPAGSGPVFTSTPVQVAVAGQTYTYTAVATGSPAPVYSLKLAPTGMQINATTGVVTWVPARSDMGNYSVTITATNSLGSTDQNFPLEVQAAPRITSDAIFTGKVGVKYSYQVTAEAQPAPTFSLSTAPTGMTVSTTGLVEWTPLATQVGQHNVRVVATNNVGSDTQQYTIDVAAATSVEDALRVNGFALNGSWPNPVSLSASPLVSVGMELARAMDVRLVLTNVLGQSVAVITEGRYGAGRHTVSFDLGSVRNLPAGMYMLQLSSAGSVFNTPLTIVK